MDSNFTVGDRVSHEDYVGAGIIDEILEAGISVSWCEWEDEEYYRSLCYPLFTAGLYLIERAEVAA